MEKTFTTVLFLSDNPHLAVLVKFYVGMAFHVCQYIKILLAKRLGISVGHPALPSTIFSDFGLDIINKYYGQLPEV